MKKLLLFSLLVGSMAMAQVDAPTESPADSVNEPADGTIAKPTIQQKKTVQKPAVTKKIAPTKSAPAKNDISEIVPVPDEPYETPPESPPPPKIRKQSEIDNIKVTPTKKNNAPNLFGFHGDVNVPHILNLGLDYVHSSRYFSVALNAGGYKVNGIGKSTDLPNGANVQISNQEAVIRYHPFAGVFYFGLGYGKHEVTLEANRTVTVTTPIAGSADVAITDKVKANYLLPHIGWLWQTSFGLTFGMDLGYLAPSSTSVDLTSQVSNISNGAITPADVEASADYKKARQDAIDQSEKYGKSGLPYWTVIRIGYLF